MLIQKLKEKSMSVVTIEERTTSKKDDESKGQFTKNTNLDNLWLNKVDYILSNIYEMFQLADTNQPCFHLTPEWWEA